MKTFFTLLMFSTCVVITGAPQQVTRAGVINSRAELGASDFIDWAQLGPAFSLSPSISPVVSDGGHSATVAALNDITLGRFDQGIGFNGNFAPGDALLYHERSPAGIGVFFTQGVTEVGSQVQRVAGGAFFASIAAYDEFDNLLESWQVAGFSDSSADNSAVFIGVSRPQGDIRRVNFSASPMPGVGNAFLINRVSFNLVDDDNGNFTGGGSVPEPTSATLMGLGVLLVVISKRTIRPSFNPSQVINQWQRHGHL